MLWVAPPCSFSPAAQENSRLTFGSLGLRWSTWRYSLLLTGFWELELALHAKAAPRSEHSFVSVPSQLRVGHFPASPLSWQDPACINWIIAITWASWECHRASFCFRTASPVSSLLPVTSDPSGCCCLTWESQHSRGTPVSRLCSCPCLFNMVAKNSLLTSKCTDFWPCLKCVRPSLSLTPVPPPAAVLAAFVNPQFPVRDSRAALQLPWASLTPAEVSYFRCQLQALVIIFKVVNGSSLSYIKGWILICEPSWQLHFLGAMEITKPRRKCVKGRSEVILTERSKGWEKYSEDVVQIQTLQTCDFPLHPSEQTSAPSLKQILSKF